MRLVSNVVEAESIGFDSSVKAQIKNENLGFIWDALTTSFYQNPVGSAVRECANNVEDANRASSSGAICQIRFDHGDNSIHFIDKGPGMSPDFMQDTYMSLGESTKTGSDEFIGGFGMGRFSVLSYTNTYYIDTVVDGIRYSYMLSKTSAIPDLDLLDQQPTDDPNGTDVWFYIKNGDFFRFRDAARHQLKYFDSAFLKGFGDLSNEYTLLKGQNFVFRPDQENPGGMLEVCYGKNVYPIDWHSLGMEPIELNCAVYFEIGQLSLIRNREQLQYDERTIKALKMGIQAMREELVSLYEKDATLEPDLIKFLARRDKPATIRFMDQYDLVVDTIGLKSNLVWTPIRHLNLTVPRDTSVILNSVSYHWHRRFSSERNRYSKPDPMKSNYFGEFYYAASGNFTERKNRELGQYAAVVTPRVVIDVSSSQIDNFYKGTDLKRRHVPEQRDGLGKIIQESAFVVENPRNIDWEAEIREFHQIVRKQLIGWYHDYDSVEVSYTKRVYQKRQDDEVLCSINGNPRRNIKLSTLRWMAVNLVFCETQEEVEIIQKMLAGTPYRETPRGNRTYSKRSKIKAEKLRKRAKKYSEFGQVVATVFCPKKYRQDIFSLPNLITFDSFWKTNVFRRIVQIADGVAAWGAWNEARYDLEQYNRRQYSILLSEMNRIPRGSYGLNISLIQQKGREYNIAEQYPVLISKIAAEYHMLMDLKKSVERYRYKSDKIGKLLQSFAYLKTQFQVLKENCHGQSHRSVQADGE